MSEVSCTNKPLHVAAYVVYNLGASVILGIARLIIAAVGYAYYSCCSSGARLSHEAKVNKENGNTFGTLKAGARLFFNNAKDQVTEGLGFGVTEAEARAIFRRHALRGLAEVTIIGAWWYTHRDTVDRESGLFGLSNLERGFNRLEGDIAAAN